MSSPCVRPIASFWPRLEPNPGALRARARRSPMINVLVLEDWRMALCRARHVPRTRAGVARDTAFGESGFWPRCGSLEEGSVYGLGRCFGSEGLQSSQPVMGRAKQLEVLDFVGAPERERILVLRLDESPSAAKPP